MNVANATKSLLKISVTLKNGDKFEGTWDAANEVFTSFSSTVNSVDNVKDITKKLKGKKSADQKKKDDSGS